MQRNSPKTATKKSWWDVLNSPLVLLLISGVLIAGLAKIYTDRQAAVEDQVTRRAQMGRLLTEYQHRLSELAAADARLDAQLGSSGTVDHMRRLDRSNRRAVAAWDRLSDEVSRQEWDILTGHGAYRPTAPEYAGLSLIQIASQIDVVAGVPDIQFGAIRMIGIIDVPPPATWVFVRSQLPMLTQFGVSRNMFFINQTLPLMRSQSLTEAQMAALGFPRPRPGELERLRRENEKQSNRLINALENAQQAN